MFGLFLLSTTPLHHAFQYGLVLDFAGALAAYNKGDQVIKTYDDVDKHTTGRDYANDVIARAQWYKENGGF